MLSDRRQLILSALIEEYVSRALPVGSRTLTERYSLGVSPATVRNDLSALEDAGFITQPHTSAGRIPTDAGYRAFVDELLNSDELIQEPLSSSMVEELRRSAAELDELLEQTSSVLSRLTNCLSIVADSTGRPHRIGLGSLLMKPEFSDSATLAPVVEMVEDTPALLQMLDRATAVAEDDLMVSIGTENAESALRPVSVIAGTFGHGESEGIVAVIGPTRMNYEGVIRAVRTAQLVLNDDH